MLLPVLVVVVPATVLVLAARLTWNAELASAADQTTRTAEAAAETAERALSAYAVAAARVNDRLAELVAQGGADLEHSAHLLLASLVVEFDPPVIATALDAEAVPIAMSHMYPLPGRTRLPDRDFFQALRQDDAPAVHVSRMFIGRLDGRLLIAISRARRVAGRFDGVVTISVDPNTIGAGLGRVLMAETDSILLRRADGAPIASSIPHDVPLPDTPHDPAFGAIAARGDAEGHYRAIGPDGAQVMVAVRRLRSFDVYAVAMHPFGAVTARWRTAFAPYLAFGIPAIAALLVLSLRLRRDQARLVAANAALQHAVERSEERLERARRFALIGTFEADLRTGRSLRSPEYMAMHGLPARSVQETHEDWVRRLHPDDRAAAEARLRAAIADESSATEYAQTYRTITPAGEVRWISARGVLERDANGRALVLRGIHVDVTSLRSAEVQLAEADARLLLAQDAVGIGAWEWVPATGTIVLAPRTIQLLGIGPRQPAPGARAIARRILPQDRPALWHALRKAMASGGAAMAELRLRAGAAAAVAQPKPWIIIRARRIDLGDGKGRRVIGVAYDITERKQAEARASILAREVEHRARNAMTLVAGLARMTTAPTHEEFVDALVGRIASLAKTMTLLGRSRWAGASIDDLLREELAAFLPDGDQGHDIRMAGPEVVLGVDAAQNLSIALHELATNSAKYGALSVHAGVLDVSWLVTDDTVTITWREDGGPPLRGAPTQEGFGSFLIHSMIEQQLGGSVAMAWEPNGLRCRLTFPLTAT